MENIIWISVVRILKLWNQGVVEASKSYFVTRGAHVVGIVNSQHLLLVHPVWDTIKHIVDNTICCDSNVILDKSILSTIKIFLH